MRKASASLVLALLFGALAAPLHADELDGVAKTLAKAAKKLKNPAVAVLPFPYTDGTENRDSAVVSERLTTKLASHRKVRVVERSLLEKVLSELKLQHSGAIDQESAKQIGSVLGVEAVVSGTLIELGGGKVEVNARLIQAESGVVLAAAGTEIARDWKAEPARAETDQAEFGAMEQDMITDDPDRILGGRDGWQARGPVIEELRRGWRALSGGKGDEAERRLTALQERFKRRQNPQMAGLTQLYLAELSLRRGNFDEAVDRVKPVARQRMFPKLRAQALFIMARANDRAGRPGAAANMYREILQNHPFEQRLIRASGHRMRALSRK